MKDSLTHHMNVKDVRPELKANGTVYADRMHQWDSKKYNKLSEKHFGNTTEHWGERSSEKIQSFLRDYIENQKLILVKIERQVGPFNGFLYWRFDYYVKPTTNKS